MSASAHDQRKTSKEDLKTTKTKPNSTKTRSFTHWDKFWHDAVKENEQKMRDANRAHFKKTGDQKFQDFNEGIDSDRAYMDACHKLDRGVPRYAVTLSCSGCGCEKSKDAMMRLECAQCLEMYKERKMKVVVDAFERAFFCSEIATWNTGKNTECDTGRRIRERRRKTGKCIDSRRTTKGAERCGITAR